MLADQHTGRNPCEGTYDGYNANSGLYSYTYTGMINATSLTPNTGYAIVISGAGGVYSGGPGAYTGTLNLAVPAMTPLYLNLNNG